jgi:hypothetical protein
MKFCIDVIDVPESNFYHIVFEGKSPRVWRANVSAEHNILILRTTSTVLYSSFESNWGGDAICVGYGCHIAIRDRSIIPTGLHTACVNLLMRYPKFTGHLKTAPVRALRAFIGNPGLRRIAADRILKRHTSDIVNGNHWLLQSPAQICSNFHFPIDI